MASIRKRTLPSGKAAWQIDFKDVNGKRRSRQFQMRREAGPYPTRDAVLRRRLNFSCFELMINCSSVGARTGWDRKFPNGPRWF